MLIHKITQYHIKRRKRLFDKNKGKMKWIRVHNTFHRMLIPCIKLMRCFRKHKLVIVGDGRANKKKPAIYACTHIGGFDVENLFEAIKSPCYLFLGDPKEMYFNFDGLMLGLNGVICVETDNKEDRYIAKIRATKLMKSGGSLMIFPEGAWNIYESLPVMPLFWGTVDIAIQSNADIIPVAIELYDNNYYVKIGERIKCKGLDLTKKLWITQRLRDELATLKWEIWEKRGVTKKEKLKDTRESFLDIMFAQKKIEYTVEDILKTRFYPKDEVNKADVMRFMEKLEPKKENAFLWRK